MSREESSEQRRGDDPVSLEGSRKTSVPTKLIIDVEKELQLQEENFARTPKSSIVTPPDFSIQIPPEVRPKKKDFKHLLSGGGRKANIKNLLMKKAQDELAREKEREEADRRRVISERVPKLAIQGKSQDQLISYCEKLVELIKKAEAEKWDLECTMKENDQKIMDLKQKAMEGTGKFVKPGLKRTGVNLNKSAAQAEIERRKGQARMRMQAMQLKASNLQKEKKRDEDAAAEAAGEAAAEEEE